MAREETQRRFACVLFDGAGKGWGMSVITTAVLSPLTQLHGSISATFVGGVVSTFVIIETLLQSMVRQVQQPFAFPARPMINPPLIKLLSMAGSKVIEESCFLLEVRRAQAKQSPSTEVSKFSSTMREID